MGVSRAVTKPTLVFAETEGVFAKRLIKPRTQFGPLEAPPLQDGIILPPDIFDVRVSVQAWYISANSRNSVKSAKSY